MNADEAAKIAKTQMKNAECETVGGSIAIFCPDGVDGPYTMMGIYNGPGTGWKYLATYTTYPNALRGMVAKIESDLARG